MNIVSAFKEYQKVCDSKYGLKGDTDIKEDSETWVILSIALTVAYFLFLIIASSTNKVVFLTLFLALTYGLIKLIKILFKIMSPKQYIKEFLCTKRFKPIKFKGEIEEIFNFEDESTLSVFKKRKEEIEKSLLTNKFLDNNLIFSLMDDIGYLRYNKNILKAQNEK